jgi:L-malate glycosyltransferase
MTNPKILMVTNHFYPSIGGLERQALRLAGELIARGVRVEVLTPRFDGLAQEEVVGQVRINRFPVLGNPHRRGNYLSKLFYFLSLSRELWKRRRSYDVIHVHQALFAAAFSVVAAKLLGKKLLIKVSGSGVAGNLSFLNNVFAEGRLMLAAMRSADAMISLSRETTEELLANGFRSEQIHEIPNGVPIEEFTGKGGQDGSDFTGKAGSPFVAVYIGRVSLEQKRLDILVRAWAGLVARRDDVLLRIAGDGPDLPMIAGLVKELKLERHVELLGFRSDVDHLLSQSDCFVLPSIAEGMSNALLEAMCCGACCLASRIGGNVDLIDHGVTGLLFDLNEADLLDALLAVSGDREKAELLGANAWRNIRDHYSFETIAPQYITLYQSLMAPLPN